MTLNQLHSLDEQELALCLFIVNVIEPLECPKMELEARHLTWFRRDALIQKLLRAAPKMLPEAHPIFISLMAKLGVKVEIKKEEPQTPVIEETQTSSLCPTTQISSSNETTNSMSPSPNTGSGLPGM